MVLGFVLTLAVAVCVTEAIKVINDIHVGLK